MMSRTTDNITRLNDVLAGLNIKGMCVNYKEHRHLAFYDISLEPGAMVSRIERRTREIALGIKSQTPPIVKLFPKRGLVRLQVANSNAETINLLSILDRAEIPAIEESLLPIIVGETDEGINLCMDLSKHPHTLIAGSTGSGKSVFLRTMIANIVRLNSLGERDIELYLADPKRVEFSAYDIPEMSHTVINVSYDYYDVLGMLSAIEEKMDSRYEVLASFGYSSIEECPNMFPLCVVMIDEVSDLMIQDKKSKEFELLIVKLAQKCRAAGIYLVLSTQRPSADVLTGLIKANFPARIACKVSSRVDSQVILDGPGAESLLGRGDAILQSNANDRARFQTAFVSAKEIVQLANKNAVEFAS